jgi:cobalamin biosynthesis Mg chelatase CobN
MVKKEDYIKVNHEILGGLKSAIEHGADLKQAMMGFYRSGYDKQEIEHAAKVYLDLENTSEVQKTPTEESKKEEIKKPEEKKEEKKEMISNENEKTSEEKTESDKEKKKKRGLFGGKSKSKKLDSEKDSSKSSGIENSGNKNLPTSTESGGKINSKREKRQKKTKQKVSSYEVKGKKPPQGKTITIVLILVLLFLLGILTSVILFREELVIFFNSLFG